MAEPNRLCSRRSRGFTRTDFLVLIGSLVLLGVLSPMLRRGPSKAMQLQASRIRGIHKGEILFAESNNGWYAGFDRNGKLETDHVFDGEPQLAGWSGYAQSTPRAPAWRFRRLLENGYFNGEDCVSASEDRPYWQPGESMDPRKFSFALLKIEGEADSPRKREHMYTNNSQAVVISDRAVRHGSGYRSIHTDPPGPNVVDWKGSVCWGDNHVTFEATAVLDAEYDQVVNENDNLFTDSDPSGAPNAEAAMAWQSAGDTDAELVE